MTLSPTPVCGIVSSSNYKNAVQNAEHIDFHSFKFQDKPEADNNIVCHLCGITCKSANEFHEHMARIHKHRSPFKFRVAGTRCLSRLKDCHNREKLCQHLKHGSNKCANYYLARVPVLPEDVLKAEDAATAALTAVTATTKVAIATAFVARRSVRTTKQK